jgi:2-polyprenyl-6-hydroxyphenyl methylase / 3-demethylubiquinone-9 3-methyltransferase
MRRGLDAPACVRWLCGVWLGVSLSGCMSTPAKSLSLPAAFASVPLQAILEQEDGSLLGPRNLAFLPVRLEFIAQVLQARSVALNELKVLVVNGGDSSVAAALAAAGAHVTVVDADAAAVARATANAQRLGLSSRMQFVAGRLESGVLGDARFALTVVSNTFELTQDKPAVLAALARVMDSGAVIVFDTINRSGASRAIYLGAFQAFPLTSFVPSGTYAYDRFVPPALLQELSAAQGVRLESVRGFMPGDVSALVTALIGRKFGRGRDAELAQRAQMKLSEPGSNPAVTYFGVLVKGAAP